MDTAKPGHSVKFDGLKGAGHLNGTGGTLVKFLKKEKRWSVRCEVDNKVVKAKPENLILQHIRCNPTVTTASAARVGLPGSRASSLGGPSSWANGLSLEDQYEWFSNCYQMRCDDDYAWGGCNLHGPYDPDATPESIRDDFLVYCVLAQRGNVIPGGWDWTAFLKSAAGFVTFAFEKSDAKERWGSENFFNVQMGGRSLRYTGTQIYKSDVNQPGDSQEYISTIRQVLSNRKEFQNQAGGTTTWKTFLQDLRRQNRFS